MQKLAGAVVAEVNAEGERNPMPVIPVQLQGDRPPKPGEVALYDTRLELTRIPQDVVIGLYDPPSGRVLATTTRIEP